MENSCTLTRHTLSAQGSYTKKVSLAAIIMILFMLVLSGCNILSADDESETVTADEVLLYVNDTPITNREVQSQVQILKKNPGSNLSVLQNQEMYLDESTSRDDLEIYAIRRVILDELIKQDVQNYNIEVDDAYIENLIALLRHNYPTEESWNDALQNSGFTIETYQEAVYMSFLTEELKKTVIPDVDVTQQEIDEYALLIAPQLKGKKSSHILIPQSEKELADEVLKRAQNGEDFAELAAEYSIDGSAQDGGNVGWDSINSFVAPYQQALDKLKVGEISPLVNSQYGYHIIKCTDIYDPDLESDTFSTATMPPELYDYAVTSLKSIKQDEQFNTYLKNLEQKANYEFPQESDLSKEKLFGEA